VPTCLSSHEGTAAEGAGERNGAAGDITTARREIRPGCRTKWGVSMKTRRVLESAGGAAGSKTRLGELGQRFDEITRRTQKRLREKGG